MSRDAHLRQAREHAVDVIRNHEPGVCLSDDLLMRLSRVAVDAIDSCQKAQPFHSKTLDALSLDVADCVESDSEFKLAKFACAFTTLMRELNGSIIGSANFTGEHHSAMGISRKRKASPETEQPPPEALPVPSNDANLFDEDKVKQEPEDTEDVEIKQEMPDEAAANIDNDALQQFLQLIQDGPVKGEVEEPTDPQEGEPVPTVSAKRVKCDCAVCSSQETRVSRSEWLKEEMNNLLGRPSKWSRSSNKKPRCLNEPPKPVPPPPRPTGKCVCGESVSIEYLDLHVEKFHRELWLKEGNGCPVPECDFRTAIGKVRKNHHRLAHGLNSSSEYYYKLPLDAKCPYCPETMTTVGEYMRHNKERHLSMQCSRAPINICDSCNYSTYRMHLMIQHWSERRASRFGLMFKCEPRLVFDYVAARAELKKSGTLDKGAAAAAEEEKEAGSSSRVAIQHVSFVRQNGRRQERPTPLLRDDSKYNAGA